MAKGYLYDNGYELISREEALPEVDSEDEGKVLTVSSEGEWGAESLPTPEDPLPSVTPADNGKVLTVENGEWGAVMPKKDIKNSVLLKVDDSSNKLRFTPYSYDGTAITAGDLLNYADDNGMVVCRIVPSNSLNHKYTGNVISISVKQADDATAVDIMIPYVWIYTEGSTDVYLYLTTGATILSGVAKSASNFKDNNSIKLTIAKT